MQFGNLKIWKFENGLRFVIPRNEESLLRIKMLRASA